MSREMKDSGIAWIGEIPKEWEIMPFKSLITNLTTGLNPRENFELNKDKSLFYVTIRNFKDGILYLDDNCDRIDEKAWSVIQERSALTIGDILFASISKDAQAFIIKEFPYNWNINESVFSIRPNKEHIETSFFYYNLINPEFYNDLRIDATGTTFQSIKQKKLKDSILPLPPLAEQKAIAEFLDRKCSEIDELISLQDKMIEELKAYKQSIITETVTRGLNPEASLKDSGIEWIGEIPEHWKVLRIGLIFNAKAGGDAKPELYSVTKDTKHPYPVYTNSNLEEQVYAYTSFPIFTEDAITVTGRGDIGKSFFRKGGFDAIIRLLVMTPLTKLDLKFYMYFIGTVIPFLSDSAAVGQLSSKQISIYKTVFPPLSEQQEIADYLDKKCAEIDNLISLKQQKIEELKDYKKSLIYEYVTGKKQVGTWRAMSAHHPNNKYHLHNNI